MKKNDFQENYGAGMEGSSEEYYDNIYAIYGLEGFVKQCLRLVFIGCLE